MEAETTGTERRGEASNGTGFGPALSDLAGEIGTLLRQEVEMARCEIAQAAEEAKAGAMKCGMGFGMGVAACIALTAAAVLGLTLLLQQSMSTLAASCVSALIVGVVWALVAWLFIHQGSKDFSPGHFVPRRALESLKEDMRWARTRI
jgi:hypothetical protein